MKKKFFLVGALVALSMSAMFVACNSNNNNNPSNGCDCSIRVSSWYSGVEHFTKTDMADLGATTCGELATAIRAMYAAQGETASVTCN